MPTSFQNENCLIVQKVMWFLVQSGGIAQMTIVAKLSTTLVTMSSLFLLQITDSTWLLVGENVIDRAFHLQIANLNAGKFEPVQNPDCPENDIIMHL